MRDARMDNPNNITKVVLAIIVVIILGIAIYKLGFGTIVTEMGGEINPVY